MTMSGLVCLQPGTKTSVSSSFTAINIGWIGFRLDNIFDTLIGFRVARTTPITGGPITYDRVIVNVGGGWQTAVNQFVAARNGYYFFSFSGGVAGTAASNPYSTPHVQLQVNGAAMFAVENPVSAIMGSSNPGYDLMSLSGLIRLNTGNVVTTVCSYTASQVYSDANNLQTTFSGLYYSPTNGLQQVILQG